MNYKKLYPLAYAVTEKYGKLIVEDIKDILKSEGKDATGTLINSIGYRIQEGPADGDEIELIVFWADYGDYVDRGRKPGGKMPPVKNILDWVKLKGIRGKGKQTQESVAFAIAKGIQKNGIEPTFFKTLAERNSLKGYQVEFVKAIEKDIQNILNNIR